MLSLNPDAFSIPDDIKSILAGHPNTTALMLVKIICSNQLFSMESSSPISILDKLLDLNIIHSSNRGLLLDTFQRLSNKQSLTSQCIDFLNAEIDTYLDLEVLIYEWMNYDYNLLKIFITKKLSSLPENTLDIFVKVLLCKYNDEHLIKPKILVSIKDTYWSNPSIKEKFDNMFIGERHNPPRFIQILQPARDLKELTHLKFSSMGALAILTIIDPPILKKLLSYRDEYGHNIIKIFHDSPHMHHFFHLFISNFNMLAFEKLEFLKSLILEIDHERKNLFFQLYHPHKNSLEDFINYLQKLLPADQFKSILFKALLPNLDQPNLIAHDINEQIGQGRFEFNLLLKHCLKLEPLQRAFILNQHIPIGKHAVNILCLPFVCEKPSNSSSLTLVFSNMFTLLSNKLAPDEWKNILQQSIVAPNHLLSFCTHFHQGILQDIFQVVGPKHWRHAMLLQDEFKLLAIEKACMAKDFADMDFLIQNLEVLTDQEKLLLLQHANYRLVLLLPQKFLHLFFNQMRPSPKNQAEYVQLCINALKAGLQQFKELKSWFPLHDNLLAKETPQHFLCDYIEHLSHQKIEELHIKLSNYLMTQLPKRTVLEVCFAHFITMMNASPDSWSFLKVFIAQALQDAYLKPFTQAWIKEHHAKNTTLMDEFNTFDTSEPSSSLSHPRFF